MRFKYPQKFLICSRNLRRPSGGTSIRRSADDALNLRSRPDLHLGSLVSDWNFLLLEAEVEFDSHPLTTGQMTTYNMATPLSSARAPAIFQPGPSGPEGVGHRPTPLLGSSVCVLYSSCAPLPLAMQAGSGWEVVGALPPSVWKE